MSNSQLCCCAVTFVVYLIACAVPIVTSDEVDSKRPWGDMVRETRGLQMLRLGKRDPTELTDDEIRQLRQLYDFISGESRDPTRRQPPLPRYGRELLSGRDILELIGRASNPIIIRPPPRAGRYRRSVGDDGPYGRIRSVVRPRIGRYLRPLHLETKAVSRPRIGREELFPGSGTDGGDVEAMMDVYH